MKIDKLKRKLLKLNGQTMQWINESEFMQDEQKFLEHLLSTHFLALSSSKYYEPTRKLIKKLVEVQKMGNELSDSIQLHNKHLATLIESMQKSGYKDFKKEHKTLERDFDNYALNFKVIKKKIFSIIKDILKVQKQKLLISEK